MDTQLIHKPAWQFMEIWCFHTPHDALLISVHHFCSHFLMCSTFTYFLPPSSCIFSQTSCWPAWCFSADPKSVFVWEVTLFPDPGEILSRRTLIWSLITFSFSLFFNSTQYLSLHLNTHCLMRNSFTLTGSEFEPSTLLPHP